MDYDEKACVRLALFVIQVCSEDYIELLNKDELSVDEAIEKKEIIKFFKSEIFDLYKGELEIKGDEFLEMLEIEAEERKSGKAWKTNTILEV